MPNVSHGGQTFSCIAWTSNFLKAGIYKSYKITVLMLEGPNSS
jgi:hypothetical protein